MLEYYSQDPEKARQRNVVPNAVFSMATIIGIYGLANSTGLMILNLLHPTNEHTGAMYIFAFIGRWLDVVISFSLCIGGYGCIKNSRWAPQLLVRQGVAFIVYGAIALIINLENVRQLTSSTWELVLSAIDISDRLIWQTAIEIIIVVTAAARRRENAKGKGVNNNQ